MARKLLSTYTTSVSRNFRYLQNNGIFPWNSVLNSGLIKFRLAYRSIEKCYQLGSERNTLADDVPSIANLARLATVQFIALTVYLYQVELTTRRDDRRAVPKFSKSRVRRSVYIHQMNRVNPRSDFGHANSTIKLSQLFVLLLSLVLVRRERWQGSGRRQRC